MKTKTHTVQAPRQRKAGSLNTQISSSDKWSQQAHTALPGPATEPHEPASRKHFPYCCSEKGAVDQWFRIELLHWDQAERLAEIPEFRGRSLINCLHKSSSSAHTGQHSSLPAQLWLSVLPAAMPPEVRDPTASTSLCSGSNPTQNHVLKLLWKGSTDTYSWICYFIFQR